MRAGTCRRKAATTTNQDRTAKLLRYLTLSSARANPRTALRRGHLIAAGATVLALLPLGLPAGADAAPGTGWFLATRAYPTSFTPGGRGLLDINVVNTGAKMSEGALTFTDTLPPGVTAIEAGEQKRITLGENEPEAPRIGNALWECSGNGPSPAPSVEGATEITCHNTEALSGYVGGGGGHTNDNPQPTSETYALPAVAISVAVPSEAAEIAATEAGPNRATISGGGATGASTSVARISIGSPPAFGLNALDGWISNADGTPATQAGSHPYALGFDLPFNTKLNTFGLLENAGGEPRQILIRLPAGLVGNPTAISQCPRSLFTVEQCPDDTQVGDVFPTFSQTPSLQQFKVFNLVPPEGVPAELGFNLEGISNFIDASLRVGSDYGIDTSSGVPQREIIGAAVAIWGTPGESSHNTWRTSNRGGCTPLALETTNNGVCTTSGLHPSLRPFLTLPASCGPSPVFQVLTKPWSGGPFAPEQSFVLHDGEGRPLGLGGCDALEFSPSISLTPEVTTTDSPSGLQVDLHLPQDETFEGLAEADLKDIRVALPAGVAVNPSSANGLQSCSSAQIDLHSQAPASCPAAARIGSVEIDTPLLGHPIDGSVYAATPGDNPFGSLLGIYIDVEDPQSGVTVKLAGHVEADPLTGQLTTSFTEAPQLPFEDFKLDFFGGPTAVLRTPAVCGHFVTSSVATPWSTPEGADAQLMSAFDLRSGPGGSACAPTDAQEPNKPAFVAGTLNPIAGSYSTFVLHLARADGTQELRSIETTLPEGLLGKLAGLSECTDAQVVQASSHTALGDGAKEIASPSCPLSSEVGTVTVGAGAGPAPYYVTGHAYLAGPYKGAPLSLEVITPAVAGPYDLGAVAVRTALYVNEETTQIHAVSDPFPRILEGIPLDIRSIALNMNRPNFILNPTSCDAMQVLGSATSVLGNVASLANRFQVGGCNGLDFRPKLALNLKGSTGRSGNPSLRATLTYPKGNYANIKRASVALPHSEFLDQAHIKTICTRVQFAEGNVPGEKCPAGSIYGHARAITPLLDQPLEGPVYLRSSSHPLPDLVAALNGQIQVVLDGTIDSHKGGIRTTFASVPDAPVSKFVLSMQGGKKGLLENSKNLCKSTNKATAIFDAQNGKSSELNPVLSNGCKKSKKSKAKKPKRAHR